VAPQTRGRLLKTKLAELSPGRRKRLSKIGMLSERAEEERWAAQLLVRSLDFSSRQPRAERRSCLYGR
jgi:hypothetical protein